MKYTRMNLLEAVRAVHTRKMKPSVAATKFGVPQSTLYDHIRGKRRIGAGAPTILSHREEQEIVLSLQVLQEMGFGLTKGLAGVVIRDYLLDQPFRPNPFKDGIPGRDWWRSFLNRWKKEISERKPEHLPTNRAISAHQKFSMSGLRKSLNSSLILVLMPWKKMNWRIESGIVMRVVFVHL